MESGVKEPLTGIIYPRVAGASAALTGALQDQQLTAAQSALDCQAQLGSSADEGNSFTQETQLTRNTPKLIGLHESAGYDCGAHSDTLNAGVILNRVSGQSIRVAALWPGLSQAKRLALYLTAYPNDSGDSDCPGVIQSSADPASSYPQFTA